MLDKEFHKMEKIENTHWWFVGRRMIIDSFLKKLVLKKNSNILEIGSGTGSNISLLKKYGDLSLIEPNDIALEYLKKKNVSLANIKKGKCPEHLNYKKKFNLISFEEFKNRFK